MTDKLLPQSKFPWALGFSALFIALCAAFFSVYGISTLFAGASVSAMVMASSLEVGKLVATTFLYRYWVKCKLLLKTYLVIAVVVLMAVTSLGIFGYLSAAYQKSAIEFGVAQDKIKSTEQQKTYFQDKITSSKTRIQDLTKIRDSQESRMSQVLTNEFLTRNPLQLRQLQQQTLDSIASTDKDIKSENDKVQTAINDIQKIDEDVNQLKLGTAGKKDVQTFKFVADAFGTTLDKVARWFILSIICVFDPLAICLILAYNVAVYNKEDQLTITPPAPTPDPVEPQKTQETPQNPPIPDVEPPKVEKIPEIKTPESHIMPEWYRQMFKL